MPTNPVLASPVSSLCRVANALLTDAVDVILNLLGHVKVNDVLDVLPSQTGRGKSTGTV
jgi:Mg/Co/Ni transporter MgtE